MEAARDGHRSIMLSGKIKTQSHITYHEDGFLVLAFSGLLSHVAGDSGSVSPSTCTLNVGSQIVSEVGREPEDRTSELVVNGRLPLAFVCVVCFQGSSYKLRRRRRVPRCRKGKLAVIVRGGDEVSSAFK